ncbi:MAG: UDP-N-acetylmuramate dehydrogenase [Candidatus Omnitrophica bacterium]|nr:UDP-N-acetylmuramate dehydrogenase [Candidatus Omnitrophota bacterium]
MKEKNKPRRGLLDDIVSVRLKGRLAGKFIPNALMRPYTTIKTGGRSIGIYMPENTDGIKDMLFLCDRNKISLLPIGNGSNIIISEKGLNNVFLKLSSPCFRNISLRGDDIICGAGSMVSRLCDFAHGLSLSGAEFLIGIPATAGGAIFQNAGAYGGNIACILKYAECMDRNGRVVVLNRNDIRFEYRHSGLRNFIVLSACFKLKKSRKPLIGALMNKYLARRLSSQDYTAPSAGCVFKNPDGSVISAAEMIDICGLKGRKINGAQVSSKHANFIVNKGRASSEDVIKLISFVKNRVKSVFNVTLETEVEII